MLFPDVQHSIQHNGVSIYPYQHGRNVNMENVEKLGEVFYGIYEEISPLVVYDV